MKRLAPSVPCVKHACTNGSGTTRTHYYYIGRCMWCSKTQVDIEREQKRLKKAGKHGKQ